MHKNGLLHIYLLHSSCVPYDKNNSNKKQILSVRFFEIIKHKYWNPWLFCVLQVSEFPSRL